MGSLKFSNYLRRSLLVCVWTYLSVSLSQSVHTATAPAARQRSWRSCCHITAERCEQLAHVLLNQRKANTAEWGGWGCAHLSLLAEDALTAVCIFVFLALNVSCCSCLTWPSPRSSTDPLSDSVTLKNLSELLRDKPFRGSQSLTMMDTYPECRATTYQLSLLHIAQRSSGVLSVGQEALAT